MTSRRALSLAAVSVALLLLVPLERGTRAEDAAADGVRRARVVASVGTAPNARTVTVAELEDRLAEMPAFQRATLGRTPDAVRRRLLTEVMIRDALLSVGAEDAKLESAPAVYQALERGRSSATIRAIRAAVGPASAIPMGEVQAYYDQNRARYAAPERYQIWRILCQREDEARSVLAAALEAPTPKAFAQLARDHSLDKATFLRSGNLGFLTADGTSSEPGLRVDPVIVRAAQGVHDGDLVKAPVAEGSYFAVVWRRGTIAAAKRGVQEVAPQIRDALWRGRIKTETDRLLASLRAAKVHDLSEDLLDAPEVADAVETAGARRATRDAAP
jgi:peptidyl-prolyl cis-trans isomerase C